MRVVSKDFNTVGWKAIRKLNLCKYDEAPHHIIFRLINKCENVD